MNASRELTDDVKLTIIEPPEHRRRFGLGEVWAYRAVAIALTRRNLMVRYRQTAFGVAWILFQPLAMMLVFSIFFSLIPRFGALGVPFPVFYICALWLWMPMMKVVNEGVVSIIANQQLVTRVYVPRALIPISVLLATLVDLFFIFIAFQVVLLVFGYTPDWKVVVAPFLIVLGYATVMGVTFLGSALNTRYRDVQIALLFLVQMWMFLSPVIYPAQWVPEELQPIYYLNPMAFVITGSRWAFADMPAPPDYAVALAVAVATICLIGGYLYFRRNEPTFADEL